MRGNRLGKGGVEERLLGRFRPNCSSPISAAGRSPSGCGSVGRLHRRCASPSAARPSACDRRARPAARAPQGQGSSGRSCAIGAGRSAGRPASPKACFGKTERGDQAGRAAAGYQCPRCFLRVQFRLPDRIRGPTGRQSVYGPIMRLDQRGGWSAHFDCRRGSDFSHLDRAGRATASVGAQSARRLTLTVSVGMGIAFAWAILGAMAIRGAESRFAVAPMRPAIRCSAICRGCRCRIFSTGSLLFALRLHRLPGRQRSSHGADCRCGS